MADQFESYLPDAIAPPMRAPDRQFVARVQAQIVLDARLDAERRAVLHRLSVELLGLVTVTAALVWLGRAAPISDFVTESPELALSALLSIFSLVVAAVSFQPGGGRSTDSPNR